MKTTVDIPRELLEDVKRASNARTMREAITVAMEEYLRVRRSAALIDILGTFDEFMDHGDLDRIRSEE